MNRPGRALIDDLPPGNYTAVFKDIPGHTTPAPQTRALVAGGRLSFVGEYKDAAAVRGGAASGASGASGGRGSGTGRGEGTGSGSSGSGSGGKPPAKVAEIDGGFDRRVNIVVTSYPPTSIERYFTEIPYPEVIIRKSNFQQGVCQVYLILRIDARGDVEKVLVERPDPAAREQYKMLIAAVEAAVRSWDYDRVAAEVHVDVRFFVE
jgi:hypothetical protein